MVKITKGCLIKTEPSIKEVIVKIGELENFIIEDINDNLLFITENGSKGLKEKVESIMSSVKEPHKNF